MVEAFTKRFPEIQTTVTDQTASIYKNAFAGYPWFEQLTDEQVQKRLEKDFSRQGVNGVWLLDENNNLIGASWYYNVDLEELRKERGEKIAQFVERISIEHQTNRIVWHSMTLVSPEHQGHGVGGRLKQVIFEDLQSNEGEAEDIIYLTRIRSDNLASQKMNEPHGLLKTGIILPASKTHTNQADNIMHEYWYTIIHPQSKL